MYNINTKSYWDKRFSSGDWESKLGRAQTKNFAKSQIKLLNIPKDFNGTLLDFGCGLGDAFPIYYKSFPNATLIGMDISNEAIIKCKKHYGNIANFICGSYENVPQSDIIISSNVFEHLTNDKEIALHLLKKCNYLYIIVPYNEVLQNNPEHEHINSYNEHSFDNIINSVNFKIFYSKSWGESGINLYYNIYFKNIARFLLNKKLRFRPKQIIYKLKLIE